MPNSLIQNLPSPLLSVTGFFLSLFIPSETSCSQATHSNTPVVDYRLETLNLSLFFVRMFIWRSLLKLPENHAAYSSLVDKGTHNAFARLHEEYPIKSRKLLRVLQRLVIGSNYGRRFFLF